MAVGVLVVVVVAVFDAVAEAVGVGLAVGGVEAHAGVVFGIPEQIPGWSISTDCSAFVTSAQSVSVIPLSP